MTNVTASPPVTIQNALTESPTARLRSRVLQTGMHSVTRDFTLSDVPHETLFKILDRIYDCALNPDGWQETVSMIAKLCRSHDGFLEVFDSESGRNSLVFHVGCNGRPQRLCEDEHGQNNPLIRRLRLLPTGTVATRAMLVEDTEFLQSSYYQEVLKPRGLREVIAVNVLKTEQHVGFLIANRLEAHGQYGRTEVRLLNLLAPHVCRSMAISTAFNLQAVQSETLEVALHSLAAGVYLVDQQSRIIYLNRAAERQARSSNALRIANNRLSPVDRSARVAFYQAIAGVPGKDVDLLNGGLTLALPGDGKTGLVATILPLNQSQQRDLCGRPAVRAAIFVQDPIAAPPLPGEAFAKLYFLTASELRVLLAMSPGLTVKEAADMLGVSEATAKSHLHRIYAKTNTSKQTELLHLLMASAPPVNRSQHLAERNRVG